MLIGFLLILVESIILKKVHFFLYGNTLWVIILLETNLIQRAKVGLEIQRNNEERKKFIDSLTESENLNEAIIGYLIKGYKYQMIADTLNTPLSTIKKRINIIYKKHEVKNRTELYNSITRRNSL